jgi:hypothetical protein
MSIFRGAGGSGASNDSATLNDFVVISDLMDVARIATEAAATAAAADVIATNQDTIDTAADLVATNQDTIDTAADLAATNQDAIDTAADLALTNADVVLTHADVVLAEADKVQTGLDRVATNQDTIDTAADVVLTNADVVLTNADVGLTNADVVLTNADVVLAEADKVQTGLDRVATGNDKTATNADVVQTGLDRVAAASSAASAASALDNFDDRYLGAKATAPSVDNDGDALVTGALYFLTGTGMQTWDGSIWISSSAAGTDSLYAYEYIATSGQTTFSGADTNSQTLAYTSGNIHVTYGGLDIPTSDYVATNGTSLVLDSGALVGTIVRIVAFESFDVANTYTKAQADALLAAKLPLSGGTMSGTVANFESTGIDDQATATQVTITDTAITFNQTIVAPVTVVQTHLITTSSQSITSGTRANISGLNATITPTSTSKRIKVTVRWNGEYSHINNHSSTFGIKRDSIDVGNPAAAGSRHVGISIIAQGYFNTNADSTSDSAMYSYIDSPATTSATTYHATFIQVETGTLYNQRTVSDTDFNTRQRLTSTITLEEID